MPPEYKNLLIGLPVDCVNAACRHGLALKPDMDVETWSRMVSGLVNLTGKVTQGRETLTAWLGDLLAYGDGKYKGQITEYAKASGLSAGTLRWSKLVASRIPVLCRHNTLTWSHHCEIGRAFENLDEIKKWIQIAVDKHLSTKELRQRIRLYLKDPNDPPPAENVATSKVFLLMRELRNAERVLCTESKDWKTWSPETCLLALEETRGLAAFVDHLRMRSPQRAAS